MPTFFTGTSIGGFVGPPLNNESPTVRDVVHLLKKTPPLGGLVNWLKHRLRPYICPFHLLLKYIEGGKSYFDIGCGSGAFLRILAEYKYPTALGGVEVAPRLRENAVAVLAYCRVPHELQVYDGMHLPPEISDYDYLTLIDVLHHLPLENHRAFLSCIYDRMQPGQQLLIKDIDAASLLVFWNKFHDLVLSHEIGSERSVENARKLLTEIGFRVDLLFNKRVYLYPHYALLCCKRTEAQTNGDRMSKVVASDKGNKAHDGE